MHNNYEDLGYAKVDLHRKKRQGSAEVIYGAGKSAEQINGIVRSLHDNNERNIIITRITPEKANALNFPLSYSEQANFVLGYPEEIALNGCVAIAGAGTSDLRVCEEAALTCEALGSKVERLYDVGVAGIHRLLDKLEILESANVIVAVAGMEGALPSVVGGLVSVPIIGVPTSVGYGASFGGVTALLAMLNSCSSGVSVVNIDNGFGAGFLAHRINLPKNTNSK
jgi:NCAIR mutase (PurE)-related protein